MTAINEFCANHQIEMISYGRDYDKLIIDGAKHDTGPYGININMMLKFCGVNLEESIKAALV